MSDDETNAHLKRTEEQAATQKQIEVGVTVFRRVIDALLQRPTGYRGQFGFFVNKANVVVTIENTWSA